MCSFVGFVSLPEGQSHPWMFIFIESEWVRTEKWQDATWYFRRGRKSEIWIGRGRKPSFVGSLIICSATLDSFQSRLLMRRIDFAAKSWLGRVRKPILIYVFKIDNFEILTILRFWFFLDFWNLLIFEIVPENHMFSKI